jgi:hypothetical protein
MHSTATALSCPDNWDLLFCMFQRTNRFPTPTAGARNDSERRLQKILAFTSPDHAVARSPDSLCIVDAHIIMILQEIV